MPCYSLSSALNIHQVCNYIRQRSMTDFQCIVISLKDMFYEHSQALVGICRDVSTSSSRTLTLDLTKFDKPGNDKQRKSVATPTVSSKKSRKRSRGTDDDDDEESARGPAKRASASIAESPASTNY